MKKSWTKAKIVCVVIMLVCIGGVIFKWVVGMLLFLGGLIGFIVACSRNKISN